MQEYLHSHFESMRHNSFLEDVSVTLIDKTNGSDPTKRETFSMHTLKTSAPYRLNVENVILNSVAMPGGQSLFSKLGIARILD